MHVEYDYDEFMMHVADTMKTRACPARQAYVGGMLSFKDATSFDAIFAAALATKHMCERACFVCEIFTDLGRRGELDVPEIECDMPSFFEGGDMESN